MHLHSFPRLRRALLLPLFAIAALAALIVPGTAAAANTGSITGTVTDAAGNVSGATAFVYAAGTYGGPTGTATSSPVTNGTYTVGNLAPGNYVVEVVPPSPDTTNDVTTWSGNVQNSQNAAEVAVGTAATTENVAVISGGELTGTISNSSGAGVGSVSVDLVTGAGSRYIQDTATNGTYTFNGIPAGSYDVYIDASASDIANMTSYTSQWYQGGAVSTASSGLSQSTATAESVTAGQTATLNQTLGNGYNITGTLNDGAGAVAGTVTLDNAAGTDNPFGSYVTDAMSSASTGAYTLYGVPTGTYVIDFTGPFTNAAGSARADASGWYAGSSLVASAKQATGVSITNANATANAPLGAAGSVSGTVTSNGSPVNGVTVDLYDAAGDLITRQTTATDGTYTFNDVLAGAYKVEFVPTYSTLGFQYYNGVSTLAAATAVNVSAGTATTSINGALTSGGTVSGTVTSAAGGAGVSGVTVELLDAAGNIVDNATTGANGTYTISGVAPGSYDVEFVPPNNGTKYQVLFYPNNQVQAGSTAITVTAGQTTSGINGSLQAPSTPGATTTVSTPTPVAVGATLTPATPIITGTAKVGDRLTANAGNWTTGTTFAYQWYAGTTPINGATSSTYTLAAGQYKDAITVVVTGEKSGYNWVSEVAKPTSAVAVGSLKTGTPSISGTAKVGDKLTAKTGDWTSGTKFSYQWYASKKAVRGATKSTFKLGNAQKGKYLTVKVIGRLTGYAPADKVSKSTKKVI